MNDQREPMTEEEIAAAEPIADSLQRAWIEVHYSQHAKTELVMSYQSMRERWNAAAEGWPRALAEVRRLRTESDQLSAELARTWNAVGMLGKRDWTSEKILTNIREIVK